jgi:hypothetical protein
MKYQFPRHLFVPFLIYDAVNESTPTPPPPPPSRTVQVKIKPLVDYVENIIQYSKSDIVQSITQLTSFTLISAGKGELIINGGVTVKQTLDASATARSYINDTIVNRLTTELPDLFANVVVSGSTPEQDPELWMSLTTRIRDNITQTNYAKIVQSTFDENKAYIYVRGKMEISDGINVDQSIVSKVLATNIIQSIIDNVSEIQASSGNGTPSEGGGDQISWPGVIAAVLSSSCSCFICILIIILLVANKK